MAGKPRKTCKDMGRKDRLILALLSAATVKSACETAKVPETTARRWLRDPEFAAQVEAARRQLMTQQLGRVSSMIGTAFKTLEGVCKDKDQLGRDRVNAAGKLIDAAFKVLDLEELRDRVAKLEDGQQSYAELAAAAQAEMQARHQEAQEREP